MLEKLNIRHVEDLLDRIDPFLYYLASKYQKYKENNQCEAFFQVDFSFGNPNKNHTYVTTCFVIKTRFVIIYYKMGWENIITIRVDSYNPFCNKNPNCNKTLSLQ